MGLSLVTTASQVSKPSSEKAIAQGHSSADWLVERDLTLRSLILYDQRLQNPRAGGSDAVRAFWETSWDVRSGDSWLVPCQAGKKRLKISLPNKAETKHLVVWTVEMALSVCALFPRGSVDSGDGPFCALFPQGSCQAPHRGNERRSSWTGSP